MAVAKSSKIKFILLIFLQDKRYMRYVRYIHYHLFTRNAYSKITTFFLSVNILNDNLDSFGNLVPLAFITSLKVKIEGCVNIRLPSNSNLCSAKKGHFKKESFFVDCIV